MITIEYDVWHQVRQKIHEKRDDTLAALRTAADWEAVARLQSWLDALEWVLAEGRPHAEM